MIFIFSKLFIFLFKPLIWIVALSLYALLTRRTKFKKRAGISAVVLLLLFSNSWLFNGVVKLYEAGYPKLQHYSYGLLLGGFINTDMQEEVVFNASSDRILQTIHLYKSDVIEKILLSGGNSDLLNNEKKLKEADLAANYLHRIGIPDSAVIVENQSRNTKENLIYSRRMINDGQRILVITSAWHIPRVRLIARKTGLTNVDFYPTNTFYKARLSWTDYLIPDANIMNKWSILIKEWIGYLVVRIGLG